MWRNEGKRRGGGVQRLIVHQKKWRWKSMEEISGRIKESPPIFLLFRTASSHPFHLPSFSSVSPFAPFIWISIAAPSFRSLSLLQLCPSQRRCVGQWWIKGLFFPDCVDDGVVDLVSRFSDYASSLAVLLSTPSTLPLAPFSLFFIFLSLSLSLFSKISGMRSRMVHKRLSSNKRFGKNSFCQT